jgi:hypothetical protein
MDWRFLKTKDERLQDTLAYVGSKLSDADANDVAGELGALSPQQQQALGGVISLGFTGTTKDERTANREARRAKRAIMMVTSLYINDLGYRNQEMTRVKGLPETSEADLVAELKSWFTLPNITGAQVAQHAVANIKAMPNWDNKNFQPEDATRGKYQKGKQYEFNCYNGVVYWAFQAGAISRRFLWNYLKGKDGQQFFPIFSRCGWVTDIEWGEGKKLVKDDFNGGDCDIPAGLAVYYVTPSKVFGHVALSIGNGEIISQNSVAPAFRDKIKDEDEDAVHQMERAETHIISIRNFYNIHYNQENGYTKLQHTATPFWEAFPANER